MAKGIMVVATSPAEGREDEYNEWYGAEHIPEILEIPGFQSAKRFKLHAGANAHKYLAIYEIEADELTGPAGMLAQKAGENPGRSAELIGTDPAPVIEFYEVID